MGKLREKLKSMDRKTLYRMSAVVFTVALLLVTFTFAWFTSRDVVTNSIESNEIDITLLEPAWYDKGQELAKTAEPGMWIPKDPYVLNNSNIAVYVRMKVVIKVKGDNDNYDDISNDSNLESQYDNILKNYLMYLYTEASGSTSASSTPLLTGTSTSNNPKFFYRSEDGWFYYGSKEAATTTVDGTATTTTTYTFTPLASGSSTEKLFSGLLLPAKKVDYNNDVFDKDFRIDIEAQAIGADANLSAKEVLDKFNSITNNN